MITKQKIIYLLFLLVSTGWGCIDGVEVELWDECYNIEETTSLNLSQNELIGEIPQSIGNLINLTYLNLYSNQLTGDIPSNIGNLINLTYLDLQMNQLSGPIPTEIGNLENLIILHLNDNNLSGVIPDNICDLTIDWSGIWSDYYQIPYFNIDNNNFCHYYPECLTEENIGFQDTSSCEEECLDSIEGDLNNDGILNILDVVTLVTCILSDNRCNICFDINYDEEINIVDIINLVNLILDI
jgi:hypothetical protein